MHFTTILALATTALALPTAKPANDGSWYPGKYEGGSTGYDDGQYHPATTTTTTKREDDDGSWYPASTRVARLVWTTASGRRASMRAATLGLTMASTTTPRASGPMMGRGLPEKYEGGNTGYDDGKWSPEKYD
ncbi:hypothetical protein PG994_014407 [Apiospora phragmitis]|uniref:Uncharacterized protein n=1 Tax=Apiospora phragmitis TaxID=2905665 RepID=A0ABR1T469_9PEZI